MLGLRLRGGAGSDSEYEPYITEFFKPIDRESEEYKQVQARHEDVGVEDGPVHDAEDDTPEHAGTGFRRCGARTSSVLRRLNLNV